MGWDRIIEITGFIVGLIYLWYEYHANPRVWLVSVIMPLISMWLYFRKGLYADFGINIYYVAIAVYGYLRWTRNGNEKQSDANAPVTHVPSRIAVGCAVVFAILWGCLYLLLEYCTDSTVPVPDAFTTALSIVALWMMARKYAEQWLGWLVVDAVCVGLYIYKDIPFYAALYAVYTVIAWLGYRKWLGMIKK
ncbi:MAG: nicotinamide riboside transporter PnuC [Muribaculaceae bacterium]|nr:nicotinamide riboside transporter PnuC [Muribaculaceae bacterium]